MSLAGVAVALVATTLLALVPIHLKDGLRWIHDRAADGGPSFATGIVLMELAVFGTAGLGFLVVPDAPAIHWHVPTVWEVGVMLAFPPILFASGAVLGTLASALNLIEDEESASAAFSGPESLPAAVAAGLLFVGPAEELLFRGFVQGWLTDAVGPVAAILVMSVQFGLFHYPNSVDSIREIDREAAVQMAMSGSGGIFFGVAYLLTGNLLVPVVGHSVHVAILFVVQSRRSDDRGDADPGAVGPETEAA